MFRSFLATAAIAIVAITALPAHAGGYGFVQYEAVVDGNGHLPSIDGLVGGPVADTPVGFIGWEGFLLATDGWAQGYVGPTLTPVDWLTVGASVGLQQAADGVDPRFATSLLLHFDHFAFVGLTEFDEHGKDGLWYGLIAVGLPTRWLKAGVEWRRFVGVGPHVEVTIPHTPIGIWATWSPYDPEGLIGQVNLERTMFGVRLGLQQENTTTRRNWLHRGWPPQPAGRQARPLDTPSAHRSKIQHSILPRNTFAVDRTKQRHPGVVLFPLAKSPFSC